ncbi:MAG: NAD(P)-dependent oxidoreductase [Spirochaetales bacterium]|nr:MAG: NAD(P)-dependent oxidoreductase [Spirochaetales bacterium]
MKTIGWIGTGVMGRSMCMHVVKKGHQVNVYSRTREKASGLTAEGAVWQPNPKAVAENSDYVFAIVGYPKDVEEVFLGKDGILEGTRPGMIIVDMTTSEPSLAKRIFEAAAAKGVSALDAPVSGGDVGARNAKLAVMAGGDSAAFGEVLPVFRYMGENIAYMGPAGAGQHTKMSNQIHIATTMVGMVECLLYAHKAGLDMEEVIAVIGKGAAASWSLNNYGPRIAKGDFNPGFFIKHFVKDMGIALHESRLMNLSLPGLALAQQFYISAISMGLENLGTQSLYKVFERMNGING